MRRYLKLQTAALLIGLAAAQGPTPKKPATTAAKKAATTKAPAAKTPVFANEDDKTIYSIGLSIYRSMAHFNLTPAELELVKRGMSDAAAGKPAIDPTLSAPNIGPMAAARQKVFQDKAAAAPGAQKLSSGLIYKDIHVGTGVSPKDTDTVKVNYRGTFISGVEFDSSYSHNPPAPIEFPLKGVIRCWTEGVQKMKIGGKAQLVCPADIAYGEGGRPGIPGGATLVFDIELLGITTK